MRKNFIVAAILIALCGSFAVAGEEFFELSNAFAYKRFKKLDPSISFTFGKDENLSGVVRENLRTHRKAKGARKNPERACQEALFRSLLRFQKTAQKMGLKKVVNLRGYYQNKFDSKDKYQCLIIDNIAHVYLLGDVAQ